MWNARASHPEPRDKPGKLRNRVRTDVAGQLADIRDESIAEVLGE
jgi:hypothetical protein